MSMKHLLLVLNMFVSNLSFGQSDFPYFLQGTWKMEHKEIYERWDKLNDESLKGFTYKSEGGQMFVLEYLEITRKNNDIIYTAFVVSQNQGKGIEFKLTRSDSSFIFENPDHDFPKKIVYQKLSGTDILVQVTSGKQRGFSYRMTKQDVLVAKNETESLNPRYDEELAIKLGGDEYGMRSYLFVILKTGPNTTASKELITESFKGHMENIEKLVQEGRLIVAGPLAKNENNYRGIFILNNVNSSEKACELLLNDPAIKNGLLDYEIFTWYGSAALPEYLPSSDKIWKLKP